MAIKTGPTLKPVLNLLSEEGISCTSKGAGLVRKYGEYIYYPKYNANNESLIGYPCNFFQMLAEFASNYPSIYNPLIWQFFGGSATQAFSTIGQPGRAGEFYVGNISFADAVPWVTKTGTSFATVAFDETSWTADSRPTITDFTAIITSVSGSVVTGTIGGLTFTTTLSGTFKYAKYFTITMAAAATVGHKFDCSINITADTFTVGDPYYNMYRLDATYGKMLVADTPVYDAGPVNFIVTPGINVKSVDTVGPYYKNYNSVSKTFPTEILTAYKGASLLGTLLPSSRSILAYTEVLLQAFGDSATYPVITPNSGSFKELAWLTQGELDLLYFKKFKDCFQTQYTKRYIDMSYVDVKAICSFSDPQTMSMQFPKYDEDGILLNNPKFDSTGKQIGGATLLKRQPLYDANLISQRCFVPCLVDGDKIAQLDLSLSLLKGSAVYSTTTQTLIHTFDRFITQPRAFSQILPYSGNSYQIYGNAIFGLKDGNLVFGNTTAHSLVSGEVASADGTMPYKAPSPLFENRRTAYPPANPIYVWQRLPVTASEYVSTTYVTDMLDFTFLPQIGTDPLINYYTEQFLILKADGFYIRRKNSGDDQMTLYQVPIDTVTYGTPICFYRSQEDYYYHNTNNSRKLTISIVTTTHILVYSSLITSIPIVDTAGYDTGIGQHTNWYGYDFLTTPDVAIPIPAALQGFDIIRDLESMGIFKLNGDNTIVDAAGTINNINRYYNICPTIIKENTLQLFSLYYNFFTVHIDPGCRLKIKRVYSQHCSNAYFDKYYALYQLNKLLADDDYLTTEVSYATPVQDFDLVDTAKTIIYRSVIPENGPNTLIQKINIGTYQKISEKAFPGMSCMTVASTTGTNIITYNGKLFNRYCTWGQKSFADNNDSQNFEWFTNFIGKYVYARRGSAWLMSGVEYVGFCVLGASAVDSAFSCSAVGSSYDASVLQAGDELYIFDNATTAPNISFSKSIPAVIRSMTINGNYLYVLYGHMLDGYLYIQKIDITKFFNGDADYIVATKKISDLVTPLNHYSAYDSLFYNTQTSTLFLQIAPSFGSANIYTVDQTTLVPTFKKLAVNSIVYDWADSDIVHLTRKESPAYKVYDYKKSFYLSKKMSLSNADVWNTVQNYSDYFVLPVTDNSNYQVPIGGSHNANTQYDAVTSYVFHNTSSMTSDSTSITCTGIKDIIGKFNNFQGTHVLGNDFAVLGNIYCILGYDGQDYFWDDYDYTGGTNWPVNHNLCYREATAYYFYICTNKSGTTLYNYYKVFDVREDNTTGSLKPRVRYDSTANVSTKYSVDSTATIAGKDVTYVLANQGIPSPSPWPATLTFNFDFMEEDIISVSAWRRMDTLAPF